jgi:microcystin-dependent protein
MKKLAAGLALGLVIAWLSGALAQIVPALPFQLQNGTTADATQVMANFNQLLNSINANSAKNGANSDITSLLGLTTPLAPSVGGTTVFTGGVSGGSANAQTVTPVVPSTFSLTLGSHVVFVSNFTNTAAMTLNVAGSGAKNVFRQTQLGPIITAGGEAIANALIEVVYDGTEYQIIGPPTLVGAMYDYTGGGPPTGYLVLDGSCVSQTTFAALFSVVSTSWGSCSAGNFALPDFNQRVAAGAGNGNNRLAAAGCSGAITSTCGLAGGVQTVSVANLPATTWPDTLGVNVTGGTIALSAASTGVVNSGTGGGANLTGGGAALLQANMTVSDTRTWGKTGSVTSGGSGTSMSITQPTLTVNKIIKY